MAVGEDLVVSLDESPSTGYAWSVISPTDETVLTWSTEYVPDEPVMPGSGGTRNHTFTGAAPGSAAIELHYARSWEDVPPIDVFLLGVTVVAADDDTGASFECVKYDFCCETFCEPAGALTHDGEPDPCDCDEGYSSDPRACVPVGDTCALVD
jgi:predicted secreted protein